MTFLTSAAAPAGAALANSPALPRAVSLVQSGASLPAPASRLATPQQLEAAFASIRADGDALTAELSRRSHLPNRSDAALRVLQRGATYAGKTRFDDASAMAALHQRLDAAIAAGQPLTLALPLGGGKVGNTLKTGSSHLPDAAEWVAWTRLGAIARAITSVSGVPTRVLVLPDAPLHTPDLGMSAVETERHRRQADLDLGRLGLADVVTFADTVALLPANWSDEVAARGQAAWQRANADAGYARDVAAQVDSLVWATNVRVLAWSLERQVLVAAALAGRADLPADVIADADEVRRDVARKVWHYVGVNHALRSLAIPEHAVAALHGDVAMVRLTVHAKPGEPQPLLVGPSRRARPGLLPMHGVAIAFSNERGESRRAVGFALEAALAGEGRVVDPTANRTVWYEHAAGAVRAESHESMLAG